MTNYFKNALMYRLLRVIDLTILEKQLAEFKFTPCSSQDRAKSGWIPPLGEEAEALSHNSNGQTLIVLQREEKILPAPVISRALQLKVAKLESEQARHLTKTERDSLRDEVVQELLPRAFSKFSQTRLWISPDAGLITIDASSTKKAEDALALLRKCLGSLPVIPLCMENPIEMTLTNWLRNGPMPAGFALQDSAELKGMLEGGTVRVMDQDLTGDEIATSIEAGKQVTKLALEWRERIWFTLAGDGSLKNLKFGVTLLDQNSDIDSDDYVARFDADFMLMTAELSALITNLIEALGGEATRDRTAPADLSDDELYEDAVQYVKDSGRASISGIQRKFRIGYNRAAWLIEHMETAGIVSTPAHDGTRSVLAEAR